MNVHVHVHVQLDLNYTLYIILTCIHVHVHVCIQYLCTLCLFYNCLINLCKVSCGLGRVQ